MLRKLSEPFEVWGTRLKHKFVTDPFFGVRLQLMAIYFFIGFMIFIVFGWFINSLSIQTVHDISVVQNGAPVDAAFRAYARQSYERRIILAALFAICTYFFTEFALRSIKKSSELQQRFIAIVSHELRTPLTIQKNAAEVALRNKNLSIEKARDVIQGNLDETNRLSKTIQFLLTYSVLQNQRLTAQIEEVSLESVVTQVLPELEKESSEHGITLTFTPKSKGVISGNSVALEGMVVNLVKNAIYHTPAGGRVSITLFSERNHVFLSVHDTGSGIAKKDLRYIFQPFYRGSEEYRNIETHKGYGLGLSIVKTITELHHAHIKVNTKIGKGTTFTIQF